MKVRELHHFSDASLEGYGQCSYLRLVNEENQVCCYLVINKARVVPLKKTTVPRLELAAATVSAKMSEFLREELPYPDVREYYCTDSKIVLGYVQNEARRFHVCVVNRVQQIRNGTVPSSRLYVNTESNPAEHASRGLMASELLQGSRWLTRPEFLWKSGPFLPQKIEEFEVNENDAAVKKASVFTCHVRSSATQPCEQFKSDRLYHISSWQRVLRVVALCLWFKTKLLNKEVSLKAQASANITRPIKKIPVTLIELEAAEKEVLKIIQREEFHKELQVLQELNVGEEMTPRKSARQRNLTIKKSSCLYRLDPFLDDYGLIGVGSRIKRAHLPIATKHPVILPRKSPFTNLLIRFCPPK